MDFFYIEINAVYLSLNTDNTCGSSKGSANSDCERWERRATVLLLWPLCVNFGIFIFFLSPSVFGAFKIQDEKLWFFYLLTLLPSVLTAGAFRT